MGTGTSAAEQVLLGISEAAGSESGVLEAQTAPDERVLFVCTGNICRSPMAEAFARALVSSKAPHVQISSAGFLDEGRSVTREISKVMMKRGVDMSGHRSSVTAAVLDRRPDLIICMARQHVRAVTDLDPSLFTRTFTLKEFVRLAETEGPRRAGEPLAEYANKLAAGRQTGHMLGIRAADDIADPIGQSLSTYRKCATEIETLIIKMGALIWKAPSP